MGHTRYQRWLTPHRLAILYHTANLSNSDPAERLLSRCLFRYAEDDHCGAIPRCPVGFSVGCWAGFAAITIIRWDVVMSAEMLVGLAILGFFMLVLTIVAMIYGKIWFQAYMSNAPVSVASLIGMTFRQVNARTIVQARIMAVQAGIGTDASGEITTNRLEAHFLANGNVPNVIHSLIAAHRAGMDLDFDRACAIDLAGRDVLDAVRTSVDPKVIDCPDPKKSGKTTLSAICRNGVELRIRARVTVRTNLDQLIGGATEDTVIARVGEGIITSIGSATGHLDVLENPDRISRAVLERGLDAQTAFQIVSIDIADIDVGENIGARLQADQAEADTRVARAKAEERRAEAVAHEQEMKAYVAENRSKVILAEAEVPMAMADAFRAGNFFTDEGGGKGGNGSA